MYSLIFYSLGSIVEFAADEAGWPLFAFSSMSAHTSDVRRDGRISLTVTAPGFQVCVLHHIDQYYKLPAVCMQSLINKDDMGGIYRSSLAAGADFCPSNYDGNTT